MAKEREGGRQEQTEKREERDDRRRNRGNRRLIMQSEQGEAPHLQSVLKLVSYDTSSLTNVLTILTSLMTHS
jgi:hypothetical protein